ncbi:MAG: hypothetical protein WDZ35_13870 [Crocinitomicaceae bacterium]
MKKIIGILLIVGSIVFGYFGYKQFSDSSKSLEIGKLELKAQDSEKKNQAYLLFAGSAICLLIGIPLAVRK